MNTRSTIDDRKRQTLKSAGGLGAAALLGGLPAVVAAAPGLSSTSVNAAEFQTKCELEISLISSPDVVEDTLVIRNASNKTVRIDSFTANNVVFGGNMINCNDACANSEIVMQAGQQASFVVNQLQSNSMSVQVFDYLDANSATEHLPNGTRIVSLAATMLGNNAVLYQRMAA